MRVVFRNKVYQTHLQHKHSLQKAIRVMFDTSVFSMRKNQLTCLPLDQEQAEPDLSKKGIEQMVCNLSVKYTNDVYLSHQP